MVFRGGIVPLMPNKGIDTSRGPEAIGDEFVVAAQNFRFRAGDWMQRAGYALHNASAVAATPITGIVQAAFSNGTTGFLVCTGANIYKIATGAWSSVKGSLTLDGTGANLNSFCVLNDVIIGTNGKNQLWKFGVSTDPAVALTGSPPSTAVALLTFYNRALALAADGTLSWCGINNPDSWSVVSDASAGSAAPALKTGQSGVGLGAVGEDAFIFMSGSIWRFSYTGDTAAPYVFRVHDPVTGCSGRQSIVSIPERGLIFFANYQGIYMMQAPGFMPVRISSPLDGDGGVWSTVVKTRLAYIAAAKHPAKNEVWFSCTTSGSTNNTILVYDYERQAWTTFSGIAASTLANTEDGNGDIRVFHGDYAGYVYNNDTGTCDYPAGVATAIDAYVTSKAYPLVDGYNEARVRFARVFHDQQAIEGDLELAYGYDLEGLTRNVTIPQGSSGAVWDTAKWDVDSWPTISQTYHDRNLVGQGHHFQCQFRNRTLNVPCRIYKIELGVKRCGGRTK